jgi:hypothetical protein
MEPRLLFSGGGILQLMKSVSGKEKKKPRQYTLKKGREGKKGRIHLCKGTACITIFFLSPVFFIE